MKIKQLLTLSLIGLAVGACKRPNGGEDSANVDPEGKLVKASLALKMPKSIRTYSIGEDDPNATDEERKVDQIDVFIYDNGGTYAVDHFEFNNFVTGTPPPLPNPKDYGIDDAGTSADDSDDSYITADFEVREGEKLVYVGINLPDWIINRLKTGFYINEVFEHEDLIDELAKDISGGTPGGSKQVAFFNTTKKVQNITSGSPGSPVPITVSVSRLVAKVIVKADDGAAEGSAATWEVNGGTVSDLHFAIGQRNNQMFVRPLLNVAGITEDRAGVDPNHVISGVGAQSVNGITMLQPVNMALYKPVNVTGAAANDEDTHMLYTTENTSLNATHQDVTYVSVKAKFAPHRFGADITDGTLPPDDGTPFNTTPPANGFYAVFTGDATSGFDGLGVRYFRGTLADPLDPASNNDLDAALAEARAFVTGSYFGSIAGTSITDSGDPSIAPFDDAGAAGTDDHYIHFYPNSDCYYRIYLNPDVASHPDGSSDLGTGGYNILRNTVYIATITGINYIGTTAPDILPGSVNATGKGTPTYPGSWFPTVLTPGGIAIAPGDPILPMADWAQGLSVDINFDPWDANDQNYETY